MPKGQTAWNTGMPKIPGSGRKAKGAEPRTAKVTANITPSVEGVLSDFGGSYADQIEGAVRTLVLMRHAYLGADIPANFVLNEADKAILAAYKEQSR